MVDPLGPGAGAATLSACAVAVRALRQSLGVGRVEVGVLGTPDAHQLAVECGLSPAWRIPTLGKFTRIAAQTLSRLAQRDHPTVVVAWGSRAAILASHALQDTPLVVALDAPCESKHVRNAEFAEVLCMGDALADYACRSGWLPIRIRSVLAPMPEWSQVPSLDRNSLRRNWNATDTDWVVGVLPPSGQFSDALFAFHAMGRFALAGHGAHLVLDPTMRNAGEVRSIARKLKLNERVHFDSSLKCPWKISPAVDVWMSLADLHQDESALHPCMAAALGVPLITATGSFAASGIEHQVDGIIARPGINAFAFEMIQAAKNPSLLASMASAARVRHASQNVRQGFTIAIQECVARACPGIFSQTAGLPADSKLAAAST